MPQPAAQDHTRARILEAAGEIFGEVGFQNATVRDICTRAGANIASVNYYFRDKTGLYLEVFRHAMSAASGQPEPRAAAAAAKTPEEGLRLMIAAMVARSSAAHAKGFCHMRIMIHEMAHPTEALPRVIEEVIGPNYNAMRAILAKLLGTKPDDEGTRLCAHSIIGQVVHYSHARPVIGHLWPGFEMTPKRIDQVAAHIADFSLAAIKSLAKRNRKGTK